MLEVSVYNGDVTGQDYASSMTADLHDSMKIFGDQPSEMSTYYIAPYMWRDTFQLSIAATGVAAFGLTLDQGIDVHSLKPAFVVDDSMSGKVMTTMFALMAELERDLISIRTKEALQARKKAGVKLGRPKGPGKSKLAPYKNEIVALLRNGSQKKFVAERYGTTPTNLHLWIKKRSLDVEPIVRPVTR